MPITPYEVPTDRIIFLLTVIAGVPMTPYTDPTNRIIELLELIAGGGGGGGGTVTSVGSMSNSLAITSDANPIVGAGNIGFELQVIDITKAAFAAGESAGTLLPDVKYKISDFGKAIGNGKTLEVALFRTVKDKAGVVRVVPRGEAFSDGALISGVPPKYELSYDVQDDFISDLYFPYFNQRASRPRGGISNEIETLSWEDAASVNFYVIESTFLDLPFVGTNMIMNTVMRNATVNWGFASAAFLSNCTVKPGASIQFFNAVPAPFLDNCRVGTNCVLTVNSPCITVLFDDNSTTDVQAASSLTRIRIGMGSTFPINSGIANTADVSFESNLFEYQRHPASDAGNVVTLDSYALQNFVIITPDVAPPVNTLQITFPGNPIHKQVFRYSFTESVGVGALTWVAGGGIGVVNQVPDAVKGQVVSWIFTDDGVGQNWQIA